VADLTQQEANALNDLKAKMTRTQREEMAEIIQKEMVRRGMVEGSSMTSKTTVKASGLSGGLNGDQVKELYQDVGQAVQNLRVKKLEEQLAAAKTSMKKLPKAAKAPRTFRAPSMPTGGSSGNGLKYSLIYGVVGIGLLKIASLTGLFDSTIAKAKVETRSEFQTETQVPVAQAMSGKLWSPAEKDLLTQLDARRVELERRKDGLDKREQELKNQAQVLTERLAELRGLTSKLQELRKERNNKQEGRLAQLANVYGAMEPSEAAVLIGRLEDAIALELLERLPEKRMGQILSFMEKGRAVDLTKLLTEKRFVN